MKGLILGAQKAERSSDFNMIGPFSNNTLRLSELGAGCIFGAHSFLYKSRTVCTKETSSPEPLQLSSRV